MYLSYLTISALFRSPTQLYRSDGNAINLQQSALTSIICAFYIRLNGQI